MDHSHTGNGDGSSEEDPTSESSGETPFAVRTRDLRLTIVEYEEGSDRGTIHPSGMAGIERMETWLSADAASFIALEAWR